MKINPPFGSDVFEVFTWMNNQKIGSYRQQALQVSNFQENKCEAVTNKIAIYLSFPRDNNSNCSWAAAPRLRWCKEENAEHIKT